jgi:nitrous oxidase accessory protein NosD
MRGMRAGGLCVALATLLVPAGAAAKTIHVKPKGLDAIQRAVDRAGRDDTLVLHEGRYEGAVVIDKRLTLKRAKGERRPLLDGDCQVANTVDVQANGVVLRGLKVDGAASGFAPFPSAINLIEIETGVIHDVVARNKCGSAEYGVNVFRGGNIEITETNTKGFTDAGVYVGAIIDTSPGPLVIADNEARGNNRGVIVEDSFGVDIRVLRNDLSGNRLDGLGTPSGLFVKGSDGTLIRGNRTNSNGVYGIHLDGNSDNSLIVGNESTGNGSANLFDEGVNNCGRQNSFPIDPC